MPKLKFKEGDIVVATNHEDGCVDNRTLIGKKCVIKKVDSEDCVNLPYFIHLKSGTGCDDWVAHKGVKPTYIGELITEEVFDEIVDKLGMKVALKAVKRCKKASDVSMRIGEKAGDWLMRAFNWGASKEGHEFWSDQRSKLIS